MARYEVQIPVAGVAYFHVDAESEEDAIKKALELNLDQALDLEETMIEHLMEGNVCHADLYNAEALLLDEEPE